MAFTIECCADVLSRERLRHHFDREEGVIRLVFVTRNYCNLRGEHLAIAQITAPDDGRRCRVTIERAFAPGADASSTCMSLCRAAADTPLVGVEYDADCENIRMVAEAVVEDGALTKLQLLAMVDGLIEAAESWQTCVSGRNAGNPAASQVDEGTHAAGSLSPDPSGRSARDPSGKRRRGAA